MKRRIFFLFILVFLFMPVSAFAQDTVSVRGSERDGYSRVVFGWDDIPTYSIEKGQKGNVTITFDGAAQIDVSEFTSVNLKNIGDIKELSRSPLSVSFLIPKSSEMRDLKIGRRIIFDVYDAKDPNDKIVKLSDDNDDRANPQKETANVSKEENPKKEIAKKALPPAYVLVPENVPERKAPETSMPKVEKAAEQGKSQKEHKPVIADLRRNVEQKNHVISLRTTSAFNVAVFEKFGELWLVAQGNSPYLIPALSSPTPRMFSEFEHVEYEDATIHKMKLPARKFRMKAMDGGLVWTLVLGNDIRELEQIKPRHIHGAEGSGSLLLPLQHIGDILDIPDSVTGKTLKVVTVEQASEFASKEMSFVDFDILNSPIGLTILPKVDDLMVEKTSEGVLISRQGANGLSFASKNQQESAELYIKRMAAQKHAQDIEKKHEVSGNAHGKNSHKKKGGEKAFFKFNEWSLGNLEDVKKNENALLAGLHSRDDARKVEDLLILGKMFLSHGLAAEALGYFEFARVELPGLEGSAEFQALRGVANALDWKSDDSINDLLNADLRDIQEVKYWKSFVLADLGDWKQAADIVPKDYGPIYNYPPKIGNRLALVLAEVNLRNGNVKKADELMALVESNADYLPSPFLAYLKYLKGEAYRQKKNPKKTESIWLLLTEDSDDLYRTKAGLALTILLLEDQKKINTKQAIDRLERLRYAWRGDELEAQVNYWLGNVYFKNKEYVKGLGLMRDAAAIAGEGTFSQRITGDMTHTFTDLYLNNKLKDISPLDAVAIYDQFNELTPVGPDGDRLVQNLAERLVQADLLDRATVLLSHQVDHRLKGEDQLRVAIRLSAIRLLDKQPQEAMNALIKAQKMISGIPDEAKRDGYAEEIETLKIRAYAQNKQFDKALSLIVTAPQKKELNRLKADVSWKAGYWDIAADALNTILVDERIKRDDKLSREQADIILNRTIALSLNNDRIALANMREKYLGQMKETYKAHQFEVITRPSGTSMLANRETLLSAVSEVDLFKDFLDSYRQEKAAHK